MYNETYEEYMQSILGYGRTSTNKLYNMNNISNKNNFN